MTIKPECVFFDLDGTLTDPKAGITRCIQHALHKLSVEVPSTDELLWCIGPPLQESFKMLAGDKADEALVIYRERFADIGLYENEVYPGVKDMLGELQAAGITLYIASSKPKVYVDRILEHFELIHYFTNSYGAELNGTRSNKSELLKHALADSDSDASKSLMVGDRYHDVKGALNNQLDIIGVSYGYGSREELAEHGATRVADTVAELHALIVAV